MRVLILCSALMLLNVPVSPAAQPSGKAGGTPSKPAFGPISSTKTYLSAATARANAGQKASLSIRAGRKSTCSLSFTGPGNLVAESPPVRVLGFGTWRWKIGLDAKPGTWRSKVNCTSAGSGTTTSISTKLLVLGNPEAHAELFTHALFSRTKGAPLVPIGGGGRGGGGYPDADAVDCSRQFGIYSWCKRGSWLSPRRFAYRNCTDFAAWYLGLNWGSFRFSANRGNAADWKAFAGNAGLTVSSTPSVGDIAWWGSSVAGGFGHVAIVTAIASNGTVSVAEYNGDGRGNYGVRPNMRAHAYLHRPGGGGPAPTPPPPPTGVNPVDSRLGTVPGLSGTHYLYFVGNDGNLRVSHWTGSTWQHDNLQQGPMPGTSPSAYLGSGGTHYAYFAGNDGLLRVAQWTGSQWRTDNLGQGVKDGTSPSAYLGPNGTHYVYFVGQDGSLRVSHWTGLTWQHDNLGQGVLGGTSPSAYVGPNGTHFVYFVGNDGNLRVSHWTGSTWQHDNLQQGPMPGTSPSAYVGGSGTHYVSFAGNDGVLRIAQWTGSQWRTDNLGQGVLGGTSPSGYRGPNGTQYLYFVGNDGSLRVSHWTGSTWQHDNLQQGPLPGTSPSAYVGANGTHYVYFVGTDGSLRVSHWLGSYWRTDNLGQGVLGGTSPSGYLG
jgi:surface antigen